MSPGQRRRLSNPESQAQYLYEARGESSLALNTYKAWNEVGTNQEEVSLSRQHNLALLAYLEDAQKDTEQAYLTALKELHSNKDNKRDRYSKNKDLSLHELVLAYNLALHSFFSQEYREAEEMIFPIFKNISNNEEDFRYIRYGDIKCKVAFLLVDCILAVFEVDIVDEILDWIEKFIASRPDSAVDETTDGSSYTKESATQLKFRLHCYRARYLFLDSESQNTKFEANTRLARKELKNAMEIYHHQLSGKRSASSSIGDGTTSLQDSVENGSNDVNGEGNISVSNGIKNDIAASSVSNDHRLPFEIKRSEAQNQHVLFLKANLEFVKDHTKKSLKLCSETQNTTDRDKDSNQGDTSSSDEITHIEHAMYNNNVAIVHQAAGQPYLAMHYYSHALSHIEKAQEESDCIKASGIKINSDGTMTKMSVTQLLYNAAMCAKKAGNFFSAYECMSRYIELSPDSVHHPLPWLHLGQSCVGLYTSKKEGDKSWSSGTESSLSDHLSKALSYVTKCITLCHRCHHKPSHYTKFLEPARVSLAYILMELNNPAPVMRLADLVLGEPLPDDDENEDKKVESQGLRATIRMYACEAMSLMGNPKGGLKYLPPEDVDSVVGILSDIRILGMQRRRDKVDLKASITTTVQSLSHSLTVDKD